MKDRRNWSNKQKFQIILEGLKGQIEISKLCNKYQISQAQYYKWRDQFLEHGAASFDTRNQSKKEQRLETEVKNLKSIIGNLTVELKKSEYDL